MFIICEFLWLRGLPELFMLNSFVQAVRRKNRRSEFVKRRLSLFEKQKCSIILDQLPNGLTVDQNCEVESLSKVIPTVFQFLMSLLFRSSRLFWTPVCRWAICGFHPKRTVLSSSNTEHYFGALVIRLCRWFDWFGIFYLRFKGKLKINWLQKIAANAIKYSVWLI